MSEAREILPPFYISDPHDPADARREGDFSLVITPANEAPVKPDPKGLSAPARANSLKYQPTEVPLPGNVVPLSFIIPGDPPQMPTEKAIPTPLVPPPGLLAPMKNLSAPIIPPVTTPAVAKGNTKASQTKSGTPTS